MAQLSPTTEESVARGRVSLEMEYRTQLAREQHTRPAMKGFHGKRMWTDNNNNNNCARERILFNTHTQPSKVVVAEIGVENFTMCVRETSLL